MSGEGSFAGRLVTLAVLLAIGMSAPPAGAQYGGGAGTVASPYLIYTAQQLDSVGTRPDNWDKHFKLMADIDLQAYGPDEFHIIGTLDDGPFTGVFHGNHKRISNLRRTSDLGGYLGLFGVIEGQDARIENLTLAAPDIANEMGRYLGSLVGSLEGGTVSNCHVRAGNVLGLSFVGGLVGRNDGGSILDCTAEVTVVGNSRVGGLVGQSYYGTIEDCRAEGRTQGPEGSYWIGGLIGECREAAVRRCRACCTVEGDLNIGGLLGENLSGTVESCCAAGVVRGGTYAGGLAGLNSGGMISDCYSTADVKAVIYAGGLAGCNEPDCHCIVYVPGAIVRCYACGPVRGVDSGGLVGINDKSGTERSFWDEETTGCTKSDGGEGRDTSDMSRLSLYLTAGWDFVDEKANGVKDVWYLPVDGGYPRLMWELTEGDLNEDGRVDLRDFAKLAVRWRQADPAAYAGFDDLEGLAALWLSARQ
jgi:hypothetical protein